MRTAEPTSLKSQSFCPANLVGHTEELRDDDTHIFNPLGGVPRNRFCSVHNLILRVKILVHLGNLHILDSLANVSLGIGHGRSLEERVGELE